VSHNLSEIIPVCWYGAQETLYNYQCRYQLCCIFLWYQKKKLYFFFFTILWL